MRALATLILLSASLSLYAQYEDDTLSDEALGNKPVYSSLKKALKNPEQVFKLDISNAGLKEFPPEILQMTELRVLALDSNEITRIPDEIGNLKKLRELFLSNNKISTIPAGMSNLENLYMLNLAGNNISELPPALFSLRRLYYLIINRNQIKTLPESIGKLKELRALWLADNQIETIPIDIGHLYNLEQLSMVSNKIKSLPDEFYLLTKLEKLYIGENQISEISDRISHLKNLEVLALNENQLKSLPPSIGELGVLNDLYIFKNQLESLPHEIGNLVSLEELDVSTNPLKDLPPELALMHGLKSIDIENIAFNPFPQILYDLQNSGVEVKQPKGKELYTVKLLMSKAKNMSLTGDYAGAIPKYLEVIKLDTNNAVAMYELAKTYLEKGNFDSTVIFCQKALIKSPPANLIGEIKTTQLKGENKTNKYEELISVYQANITEHPNDAGPYFDLGVYYFTLAKYNEAKDALLNAIKRNPSHADSHFYLAVVMLAMKEERAFLYETMRFLTLEPEGTRAETILPFLMTRMKMRTGKKAKNGSTTYGDDFIIRDENNQVVYKSEEPTADLLSAMLMDLTGDVKVTDKKKGNEKEDKELANKVMNDLFNADKSNAEIFVMQVKSLVSTDTLTGAFVNNDEKETENFVFFRNYYQRYFKEMIDNGHLETFSYIVSNIRGEQEAADWIKLHPAQVKAFKSWSEGFKWNE